MHSNEIAGSARQDGKHLRVCMHTHACAYMHTHSLCSEICSAVDDPSCFFGLDLSWMRKVRVRFLDAKFWEFQSKSM